MRVVELRFLPVLILALVGATFIFGLNLLEDADTTTVPGPQPLHGNLGEKPLTSVGLASSLLHPSRTDSEDAPRTCAPVTDLVCVLRC